MSTIEELAREIESLKLRVASSESRLEIVALKARYAQLVDQRFSRGNVIDNESLALVATRAAELFTVDGSWDGGPGLGVSIGRDAIAERLREPTLDFSRHFFMNPKIDLAGDSAIARWDLLSPCRRGDGTSYWMSGYEDDEYERVDGAWLHRSMRLTTVFMAPIGEGWDRIFA
jgi:hypothetical protein